MNKLAELLGLQYIIDQTCVKLQEPGRLIMEPGRLYFYGMTQPTIKWEYKTKFYYEFQEYLAQSQQGYQTHIFNGSQLQQNQISFPSYSHSSNTGFYSASGNVTISNPNMSSLIVNNASIDTSGSWVIGNPQPQLTASSDTATNKSIWAKVKSWIS